jgi:outer membrane receptor protein involved in Fe transport
MQAASKLTFTPVAAAVAAAINPGLALGQETGAGPSGDLEEILVTARKRSESAQEIPIAIQALSQDTLKAMGAKAMEDYARFIPSVNVVTYSASSSTVVFRGAITGPGYIAQSTSSVYLDEISITTTGSQPGVRLVDVERVEALSGPQGTLYGSDAQAGTMRIVTNKPNPGQFEAVLDGEVRGGDNSDLSYRGSMVFNIPLMDDKLALRLVGYNDRDGGFVDNIYGHTPDTSALGGVGAYQGPNFYPEGFGDLDNTKSVEERWNDSETYGGRAALRWDVTENWSGTVSIGHQTTDSGADNYYDPYVGDLQTVRFHDEWSKDKYDLYSLTIEGDLGFAQLVSATSYYDRESSYLQDVTQYAHYWTASYCHDSAYSAANYPNYWANPETGYIVWWPVYCHADTVDGDSFLASFLEAQQDKFTQEIRLSSQGETFDWLVGLFYETSNDDWQNPFAEVTSGGDGLEKLYANSMSRNFWEWYFSNYYGTPTTLDGTTSHWYSENETDWEQKAVFGEVTWHVNDQVDLTVGGRYYDRSNTNRYFVNNPGGPGIPGGYGEPSVLDPVLRAARLANNGLVPGREGVDKEFIPKVSLSYSFGDNKMVYGLYTQGKRPGGINRTRGEPFFPANYESDLMDNYEFGYKSMFAGGSGRFNTTVYHMAWSDYQLELVDPSSAICVDENGDPLPSDTEVPGLCGQPWQQVVTNLGDAHITGVNVEIDYAVGDSWVLGMNAEYMEAQTDSSHDLDGDPDDLTPNEVVGGLRLPIVPEWKAAGWIEYHWPVQWEGQKNAYVRTQWSYTGNSLNILEPLPDTDPNLQVENPAYVIGDVRVGLQAETWDVSFFVNNVTDERAQYTYDTGWFEYGASQVSEGRPHVSRVFTNRPREIGIHFTKGWGD